MKRLFAEKRGMTLVEVIVTFVIAAILIAASSGLIISSTNLVAHASNKTMDESIADSVLNLVSQRLLYAPAISVVSPGNPGDFDAALSRKRTVLYTGDASGAAAPDGRGMLWFKRFDAAANEKINIFGASFYHGRDIALRYRVDKVAKNESKAVTLIVSIYRDGKQVLERSVSLQLLNAKTDDVSTMEPPRVGDEGTTYYDPPTTALILEITDFGGLKYSGQLPDSEQALPGETP
jgi:prepilin-type N-terminal cleavage/methylation domain-containing protein